MKSNAVTALLSRLAGLFLLVVLGAAQVQLLPLITVLAAEADGGHGVEVCPSRSGVHIVLHHPRAAGVAAPGHRHHGLLRFIAQNGKGGPHPDHEFTFASGSSAAENKTRAADFRACQATEAHTEFTAARQLQVLDRTAPAVSPVTAAWWPPPPADCAWGQVVLLL